jgi:hypothetical protein
MVMTDPTGDPEPQIVEMGPIIGTETPKNALSVHDFAT